MPRSTEKICEAMVAKLEFCGRIKWPCDFSAIENSFDFRFLPWWCHILRVLIDAMHGSAPRCFSSFPIFLASYSNAALIRRNFFSLFFFLQLQLT
jgi:hypothetical protein